MASLQTSTVARGGIGVGSATSYFLMSRQTFSKNDRKETFIIGGIHAQKNRSFSGTHIRLDV